MVVRGSNRFGSSCYEGAEAPRHIAGRYRGPAQFGEGAGRDLRMDQHRPWVVGDSAARAWAKPALRVAAVGPGIAAGLGDGSEIDVGGNGGLPAGRIVHAVVEQDMDQIAGA